MEARPGIILACISMFLRAFARRIFTVPPAIPLMRPASRQRQQSQTPNRQCTDDLSQYQRPGVNIEGDTAAPFNAPDVRTAFAVDADIDRATNAIGESLAQHVGENLGL